MGGLLPFLGAGREEGALSLGLVSSPTSCSEGEGFFILALRGGMWVGRGGRWAGAALCLVGH